MFGLAGGFAGQFVVGRYDRLRRVLEQFDDRQRRAAQTTLEHFQTAFTAFLFGVGLAIVLALLMKETGPAVRPLARQ
jgi:hypothetical protein